MTVFVWVCVYLCVGFIVSALAYRVGFIDESDSLFFYAVLWLLFYPIIILTWSVFSAIVGLWWILAAAGKHCGQ